MTKTLGLALLAVFGLGLIGCNDTAAGMAEDTQENAQAVENAAENAEEAAEEMAEDVGEAVEDAAQATLTPRIHTALGADPITNEGAVEVEIDSTAEMVTITGTANSQKAIDQIERLATQIIKEAGDGQELMMKVTVMTDEDGEAAETANN